MRLNTIFLASALFFAIGCSREAELKPLETSGEVQTVTVIGPAPIQFEPITGTPETKGTSVQDGSALLFNWEVGDTLGIFPNKGNQVEFPISAAQGSTSASFDGGGWALRNNASYAGYYPFSVWNYHRDNETIVLDYSGQEQDGNGSFAHLSAYDFLASNKTTPQNSTVTFQMERQGSILYIDIVVPEPETVTALTISCDEAIFVEKASLNISGATPVVTPIETVNSLTLSFKNTVTTAENETVRAYMAVHPVDFTDKTVTATRVTESENYTAPVTSRAVNKGRAAFLRFSDDFTPVNIDFADAEVKRICVENWDTNGDGELSYKEAAAVTDLGQVFRSSSIESFNELQYFSRLINIGDRAFQECRSLTSVIIPESVASIGEQAFQLCLSVTSINIPERVTNIGDFAFSACKKITSIRIPESVTNIGFKAFSRCSSITSVSIPESVTKIGAGAFTECSSLVSFDGKFANDNGRCLIADGELFAFAPGGLTSYSIPDGVTSIAEYSFHWGGLTSISIPESVTNIGKYAFCDCRGLKSVTIPENVTNIGVGAFSACLSLVSFSGKFASNDGRCLITGGELVAFAPHGLTSYIVPDSVTSIGSHAFEAGTNLTSISIPESVTCIGYCAFYTCANLTSITIPKNVICIDDNAFMYCRNLTSTTCMAVTPPTLRSDAFNNTNNCPIYVPNESVEAYKAAKGWSAYADRIFGIDVEGSVVGPDPQNPD